MIIKYFGKLESKEITESLGVLYEDNKTNTKWRALYNIFFLTRRMLSVAVLVYLENFPFF